MAKSIIGTPATAALTRAGIRFTGHTFSRDRPADGYGLGAARALEIPAERILKTLVVDVNGMLALALVPASRHLDFRSLAAALGGKRANLAESALAQRKTGYLVGGISPIGQKSALTTVIDASAQQFETVLVSGGRRGFDVELTPADLLAITMGRYAPIAR